MTIILQNKDNKSHLQKEYLFLFTKNSIFHIQNLLEWKEIIIIQSCKCPIYKIAIKYFSLYKYAFQV